MNKKRLDYILSQYGSIERILTEATQEEKDDYILLLRKLQTSYDEHFLIAQHGLDGFLRRYYIIDKKEEIEYLRIEKEDPVLSIFSNVVFKGATNLFFPENFLSNTFDQKLEFQSIYQYFLFQTAILFLNRDLAKSIILDNSLMLPDIDTIPDRVTRFDFQVWHKFRVKIMQAGVKSLFEQNKDFRRQLLLTSEKVIVFVLEDDFWGAKSKDEAFNNNYWGKILTRFKLENM